MAEKCYSDVVREFILFFQELVLIALLLVYIISLYISFVSEQFYKRKQPRRKEMSDDLEEAIVTTAQFGKSYKAPLE